VVLLSRRGLTPSRPSDRSRPSAHRFDAAPASSGVKAVEVIRRSPRRRSGPGSAHDSAGGPSSALSED